MSSFLALPAGRRTKFVVLAAWLAILVIAGSFAGKFEDAQENDPSSFLPGKAESLKAFEASERFPSGQVQPAVIVYARESGLTAADRARIERDRESLNARRPVATSPFAEPVVSEDRTTALVIANVRPERDSDKLADAVDDIRDRLGTPPAGLAIEVTGPAGFAKDQIEVFEQIDGTLLLATGLLVFVLLILIYRSPIFWIIPLISVIAAEVTSRGLGYGLAEAGVTVNAQSASILVVLVFGAGTDYALLLVARYREELRRHEDKHEAMAIALRRAGPAVVASGLTVIAALLCLVVAEVNGTAGLGPIAAMGIALAMVSMLTLLPALLLVAGRRAFWPFVPRYGQEGADETHGTWRRIAERVEHTPRRVWIASVVLLGVMCVGLLETNTDLTTNNGFREDVEAVDGQNLIERAFPSGVTAPGTVIVEDTRRLENVQRAISQSPGVARLVGDAELGGPGARFDFALEEDPYSQEGFDRIPELREVAKEAGGSDTFIGGPTAEERDLRVSASRDNRVIVPIVLVVVFLILTVLLRALLAPLLLIATVILSFAAALGVGMFMFEHVFNFPGSDPGLPLFAFIFLVALGIDYNIFLMARVREESLRYGTRQGILRGLAVTGAVITSAGIVLAGTFSVLGALPLVFLTEIGFIIAFGVLLDTFLVRSVLVPALAFELGPRIWWPSTLARAIDHRRRPGAPEPPTEPAPDKVGAGPQS